MVELEQVSKNLTQTETLEETEYTNKFSCCHCKKTFKRNHHLKSHMLIHNQSKPFTCQYCDKSFRQSGHLKHHVEEIHNLVENYFSCLKCEKVFSSKRKLKYHSVHVHSEKMKYGCKDCGKLLSRSKLKQHIMRDHEKTLPFTCEILSCQKKFVSHYYLKRHLLTHRKQD